MSRKTLALLPVAALALAGCGTAGNQDRIEELEVQVEELATQVEELQQERADVGDLFDIQDEFNSRMTGDVDAEIGEPVEVDLGPFENENDYAGTVALSTVEFTDTCETGGQIGSVHESQAGSFVYLTFDVETDAEAEHPIDFNVNEFRWDDYHYALSIPESLDCELDLGYQDPIEPGETGQYTAVWDVPSTTAELQWGQPTHIVTWQIDGDTENGSDNGADGTAEDSQRTEEPSTEDELIDPADVEGLNPAWPPDRMITPEELELLREEDRLMERWGEAEPGSDEQAEIERRLEEIQSQW